MARLVTKPKPEAEFKNMAAGLAPPAKEHTLTTS